jgi:hypothetical protein
VGREPKVATTVRSLVTGRASGLAKPTVVPSTVQPRKMVSLLFGVAVKLTVPE